MTNQTRSQPVLPPTSNKWKKCLVILPFMWIQSQQQATHKHIRCAGFVATHDDIRGISALPRVMSVNFAANTITGRGFAEILERMFLGIVNSKDNKTYNKQICNSNNNHPSLLQYGLHWRQPQQQCHHRQQLKVKLQYFVT